MPPSLYNNWSKLGIDCTLVQAVFFDTYISNNDFHTLKPIPNTAINPRIFVLIYGLIAGLVSGFILWFLVKILKILKI